MIGPNEVDIVSGRVYRDDAAGNPPHRVDQEKPCHATLHRIGVRVKGCGMGTRGCNEVEFKLAIQVASGQSITTPRQRAFTRMVPLAGPTHSRAPTPLVAELGVDVDPAHAVISRRSDIRSRTLGCLGRHVEGVRMALSR